MILEVLWSIGDMSVQQWILSILGIGLVVVAIVAGACSARVGNEKIKRSSKNVQG